MNRADITGVILAGGRARRMGGEDKGLIELDSRPLIEHALRALEPQVSTLLINANRNATLYGRYGYPVIPDRVGDFSGPLAGMASAMSVVRTRYLISVPCDCPALPPDLVERLARRRDETHAELCVAHDGERMQPVFALLDRALLPSLEQYLEHDGHKIDRWYAQHRCVLADFSDIPAVFANINSPADLDRFARHRSFDHRPPAQAARSTGHEP